MLGLAPCLRPTLPGLAPTPSPSPLLRSSQPAGPAPRHTACQASAAASPGSPGGLGSILVGLSTVITALFPVWVLGAAIGGYVRPELFNWCVG